MHPLSIQKSKHLAFVVVVSSAQSVFTVIFTVVAGVNRVFTAAEPGDPWAPLVNYLKLECTQKVL